MVRDADDAYRVIVMANQTVGGRALLDEIKSRCQGRRSEILVVVPALTSSPLEHWASDVDAAIAEARQRLEDSLRAMESAGLAARGDVGDHHEPNAALEDALRYFAADEVIISTHPPHRSRWLERGVVDRARREVPLPITHVVVDLEAEAAARSGGHRDGGLIAAGRLGAYFCLAPCVPEYSSRNWTRALSSCGLISWPKFWGMTSG